MRAKFSGFSEIASSRTGQLRGRRGPGGPSLAGMSQCIIISIIIVIIIIIAAMIIISNISTLIIITNINIIINMIILGWLPLTSLEGHH